MQDIEAIKQICEQEDIDMRSDIYLLEGQTLFCMQKDPCSPLQWVNSDESLLIMAMYYVCANQFTKAKSTLEKIQGEESQLIFAYVLNEEGNSDLAV